MVTALLHRHPGLTVKW